MNAARAWMTAPLIALTFLVGCDTPTDEGPSDGGSAECPGPLEEAQKTCTAADCSATSGTKTFGEATLESTRASDWMVPVWATSEVATPTEMTLIKYGKSTVGALSARQTERRLTQGDARARAFLGDEVYEAVYGAERRAKIEAEVRIRAMRQPLMGASEGPQGTAIRARPLIPTGARLDATTCSKSAPTCGASMLCVIPEGQTEGSCASTLTLKFATGSGNQFTPVSATVRKVGVHGAIVVDDSIAASVSPAATDELLDRFDRHIAVLDHVFFGMPKDRDGNRVVIIFLTPKVTDRGGPNLVGFFQSNDLQPSSMVSSSNAAEILYMQGPSATITLDQLSGTIGHEYQHLINYYAKNAAGPSDGEDAWLDEGLSAFAEDILGYGSDAFENVAAYLGAADQTSLTGNGNCPDRAESDSTCRRGMAHLFVRYFFEQKGGATFGSGPGDVSDKGGAAALRNLVQSTDTGTLLFTEASTGRSFAAWVGDLMTTIAVDGAGYPGVSCNPKFSLRAPEVSAFTKYQRGIDLRSAFTTARGMRVSLAGPVTATLETEEVPLLANSGEFRTVSVSSGTVKIAIGGAVDYAIGFHALPARK